FSSFNIRQFLLPQFLYIAFLPRQIHRLSRTATGMFFGLRNEECSSGGCLMSSPQQLAVDQWVGTSRLSITVRKSFVPKLLIWMHRFSKKASAGLDRDERPDDPCEADITS
uniref:Secreted protein n=1 Tax=Macrostomum lignano TaxID=282301 RepID=A0A1I8FL40_9PLAT